MKCFSFFCVLYKKKNKNYFYLKPSIPKTQKNADNFTTDAIWSCMLNIINGAMLCMYRDLYQILSLFTVYIKGFRVKEIELGEEKYKGSVKLTTVPIWLSTHYIK